MAPFVDQPLPMRPPSSIFDGFWLPLGVHFGPCGAPFSALVPLWALPGTTFTTLLPLPLSSLRLGPQNCSKCMLFRSGGGTRSVVYSMFSLHFAVFHWSLILDTFWSSFGSLLAPIWLPLGALGLPMGPQSGLLDTLWETLFSMSFFDGFGVPLGSPNEGAAVWRLDLWGAGKKPYSD